VGTWSEFVTWYEAEIARPFDLARVTSNATWPRDTPGSTLPMRVNFVVHHFRNDHILSVVARQLETHDRVMVVYGSGHFAPQAPRYEALLGVPARIEE
jgi:hypothetical protein